MSNPTMALLLIAKRLEQIRDEHENAGRQIGRNAGATDRVAESLDAVGAVLAKALGVFF